MSSSKKVAILGCGSLGTILLKSFLHDSSANKDKYQFTACVRSTWSLQRLQNELGSSASLVDAGYGTEELKRHASSADIILLGCAPDDLKEMTSPIDWATDMHDKTVVSLLAGVTHAQLASVCCGSVATNRIIRVLPTLGAVIGESATLVADSAQFPTDPTASKEVDDLFERIGTVQHIPDTIMAEATALGAVCHALSIIAVDTLADAGAADGIPRPLALGLAQQCLRSACGMLSQGWTTSGMKDAMAIPQGITINSILNLEQQARPAIASSARAAVAYTREMSKKNE